MLDEVPGYSLNALLNADFSPRKPMLGSWLLERSLNMIHAPAGLGKSMACLSLSLALAGGGEFLGWKAPKPRRVLYVDAEMDPSDLRERTEDLLKASGMTDAQINDAGHNLQVIPQQGLDDDRKLPDLKAEPDEAKEILGDWCDAFEPDLVILDNLSTLAEVEDENSAGGFAFVQTLGDFLKSQGVAVLLVHHDRKGFSGSESFRGSSKLDALLDVRWGFSRPEKRIPVSSVCFTLECHKCRPRRGEDVRSFTVGLVDNDDHPTWESSDNPIPPKVQQYVDAVRTRLYGTGKAIAEALGTTPVDVSRRRKKAIELGAITDEELTECLAEGKTKDDF
ncbi:AAA family ATPase [Marinobacter lacisalsi]|uniref:AAA family ATPase n=1 Tax=Marinobacter lacisalsi TaxID=475979 RepID=A0ABV8QK80_9GAMM